jgi:hypothetical protein
MHSLMNIKAVTEFIVAFCGSMEPKNVTISMWQSVQFFKKTSSYLNRLGTAELDTTLYNIIHIQKFNTKYAVYCPGTDGR